MTTLQQQQELIDMSVDFQKIDPEISEPLVTQREDLVFFSKDGMVYRRHTDQFGNPVWLILSNVLNAVGWYHVESQFVHTVNAQLGSIFNNKTINIYGDTHVNAYPGNTGSVFKMSDVTYSTSPAFSFQEYNTIALPIGDREGPLLQEFNQREWIYLYLKDAQHKLVAYTYPLVPWTTGRDHPWQVVPGRVYDPSSGLPTGGSYHEDTFFNSALVENLPVFCPTSYGKFPTSYEVNGFNGWTDLTQHQDSTNQESQTPDQFDSWQTVEQEIDNDIVQSVVDQVLNDPDEGVDETGFTTPDSLSDSGVSSSSSSHASDHACPVARQLEYGSPSPSSPSSEDGSVSSYTDSDSTWVGSSEHSSGYSDDWAYNQGYDDWDYEYRRDPFSGEWYTKPEFVDYYGDSSLWHMLSPEKEAERFMIETILVRNRPLLSDKNVNHLLNKMIKTFM
tara:strand:- start:945 stop:2285 length:1341 start_codon:yes stop_codon:yes gene_type:complete